jgi:hypothetical protein
LRSRSLGYLSPAKRLKISGGDRLRGTSEMGLISTRRHHYWLLIHANEERLY